MPIAEGEAEQGCRTGASPAWVLAAALTAGLGWPIGVADASPGPLGTRVRQPSAIVTTRADGQERLLVANLRSGSLTLLDPTSRRVVVEQDVGLGLSDLAGLPNGRHFLAVDRAGSDLLLLELRSDRVTVLARVRVSPDPVRVSVARDGSSCVVASLWSRRLTFLDLRGPDARGRLSPKVIRERSMPFFPRELARSWDDATLVVGDAFGGKLGVVDLVTGSLRRMLSLPAHNIRGLANGPDGKTLLATQQTLSPLARSSFDDLHWGTLMGNQLQTLPWAAILHGKGESVSGGRAFELGDVGQGAADPSTVLVDRQGRILITLSGVDEVAIFDNPGKRPRRIGVGRRPIALASSTDGKEIYVADSFDDTISVVGIESGERAAVIPLGPRPEPDLVERGERLFHDARLSHDGWMSCQSCHTDGHTNGLLADTLGDGSYGAPKKIPSLLGVGSTGPWNWTGSVRRLEDQVVKSITTTMQGSKSGETETQAAALTAYLRALTPIPSSITGGNQVDPGMAARGREVFEFRRCASCHAAPDFTSPGVFDVGLSDEVGNRRFNPPSLHGVSQRGPWLHDGRATTLEEVFSRHGHPDGAGVSKDSISDLAAFLRTL